jgi:hypothetical protein
MVSIVMAGPRVKRPRAGSGPPSTSYGPRFHRDVDADLRRHDASAAATGQYLGPLVLRSHRYAGNLGPSGECLTAGGMNFRGGVLVGTAGENVDDLIMDGKKPLHLPWRLEPFHDALSSSGRLMRIPRPVVGAIVLPLLDTGHDLALSGSVVARPIGDQHPRRSRLLLQQLAEQAFGGLLVAPALDEDIKNEVLLVDRAPEPMLLAGDGDDNFVESGEAVAVSARVGFYCPPR